jgi:hypothetical protein
LFVYIYVETKKCECFILIQDQWNINQDLLPFSKYLFSNKPSFTITTQYSWILDFYELWTIIKNRFLEVTQGHLTNSKWDHSMSILENKDLNSLWWWGDQLGNNQRARRFWSGGIHEDSS